MEKFKITRPQPTRSKSVFSVQLDDELQVWIRSLAIENGTSISDALQQALEFSRMHATRRR